MIGKAVWINKMVIKLRKHYELDNREYIVSARDNKDSKNYQVYYKGKLLKDVTAIVRINLE